MRNDEVEKVTSLAESYKKARVGVGNSFSWSTDDRYIAQWISLGEYPEDQVLPAIFDVLAKKLIVYDLAPGYVLANGHALWPPDGRCLTVFARLE